MTQTVTQTRKKAGGYRRTQWIARRAESTQKRRRGADGIIRPSPTIFVGYMVWLMTLPMVSAAERFIPSVAWV